jgi:uncharacterized protein YjbI with pentapeptide repeats
MSEVPEKQQNVPETPAQNNNEVLEKQQTVPETPMQNGSKVPVKQQDGNRKLVLVVCVSAFILASIIFMILLLNGFAWYFSIIPLIPVLLYSGYTLGSSWTGLGNYPYPKVMKDDEFRRAKTLWDWLQLLIVSAVLTVGGFWFSAHQNEANLQIADNQQQATILSTYIGDMSNLLLNNKVNLQDSKREDEIRIVARAKTLLALRDLEPDHKGNLVQFLYEANLISKMRPIIDLNQADLHGINLSNAHLDNIDLKGANLSGANLKNTSLNGADLREVDLSGADLSEAQLSCFKTKTNCTDLSNAILINANLEYTNLSYALLRYANFANATMSYAILNSAELDYADLSDAYLSYANLSNASMFLANLGSANLHNAILRNTDLHHADLNHADLSNANLRKDNLDGADFNHADLSDANLSYTCMFSADVSYSILSNTDMSYAYFEAVHKNNGRILSFAQASSVLQSKSPIIVKIFGSMMKKIGINICETNQFYTFNGS